MKKLKHESSEDPKSDHSKTGNIQKLDILDIQFLNGRPFEHQKQLKTRHFRHLKCPFSNGQPPFETRPTFGHSKSEHIRISDPHCILNILKNSQ